MTRVKMLDLSERLWDMYNNPQSYTQIDLTNYKRKYKQFKDDITKALSGEYISFYDIERKVRRLELQDS